LYSKSNDSNKVEKEDGSREEGVMAFFCSKCGQSLTEEMFFCPQCGNRVEAQKIAISQTQEGDSGADGNKNNIAKIVIAVVAVIVVILITKQFIGGGNNSVEAPIKGYMKGAVSGDADKMLKSFPDAMLEDLSFADKKEFKSNIKESKKGLKDLKYEIIDKEELEDDDLEAIQYEYEDYFKVKKAYTVEVQITIETLDDELTNTVDFTVVKIGSKYYIVGDEFF